MEITFCGIGIYQLVAILSTLDGRYTSIYLSSIFYNYEHGVEHPLAWSLCGIGRVFAEQKGEMFVMALFRRYYKWCKMAWIANNAGREECCAEPAA